VVFLVEQFGGRIGRLICKPLVKQLVEDIGGLNEVIYESRWVHLIRKKNVACFFESCLKGIMVTNCLGLFKEAIQPFGNWAWQLRSSLWCVGNSREELT
jgi:hypothetical protein